MTGRLTASFHLMVCTISSWVRWASFPLDLIFFGSSFWYLGQGVRGARRDKAWQQDKNNLIITLALES